MGAAIRWTKGHATQQHIDEGYSSLLDQAGNDHADSLATQAQRVRMIEGTIEAYYFIRRRAAHLMQRLMVACALARKKAMIKLKEEETRARIDMGTGGAGCMRSSMGMRSWGGRCPTCGGRSEEEECEQRVQRSPNHFPRNPMGGGPNYCVLQQ